MDYSLLVGLHFRETSNSPLTPQECTSGIILLVISIRIWNFSFITLLLHNAFLTTWNKTYLAGNGGTANEAGPRLSRADTEQIHFDPSRYSDFISRFA